MMPPPPSLAAAAADFARHQREPAAALYIVATPIGNLADISARALHILQIADVLACEDTRHTRALLRGYGIERPGADFIAVHQHNEAAAAAHIVEKIHSGQRIAFVSDAGTPGISDPGARLAAAAHAAGLRVIPIPGASAPIALLSASGCVPAAGGAASDAQEFAQQGFVFAGFLPTKTRARDAAIAELAREHRAVLLLEAPHRIAATLAALAALGMRRLTIGRELTKQFEHIASVAAADAPAWLAADADRARGEFVLLIHARENPPKTEPTNHEENPEARRILEILLAENIPTKTASQIAAKITHGHAKTLYQLALDLQGK